jgi:hypothetical protein
MHTPHHYNFSRNSILEIAYLTEKPETISHHEYGGLTQCIQWGGWIMFG